MSINLSGKVYDSTGAPVAGATVYAYLVNPTTHVVSGVAADSAVTDSNGFWVISALADGLYECKVTHLAQVRVANFDAQPVFRDVYAIDSFTTPGNVVVGGLVDGVDVAGHTHTGAGTNGAALPASLQTDTTLGSVPSAGVRRAHTTRLGPYLAGSAHSLTFDVELHDTAAMVDLGTNNDRVTIVKDGVYLVSAVVCFWSGASPAAGISTGTARADLCVDGASGDESIAVGPLPSGDYRATASALVALTAGQTVQLMATCSVAHYLSCSRLIVQFVGRSS